MRIYARLTGHVSLIESALTYLPRSRHKKLEELVFSIVSMYGNNGCCFDLSYKRIIYISEEIIPDEGIVQGTLYYRWFVYTVLHECAHAILKHTAVSEDDPQYTLQERQARRLALLWLNYSERVKGLPETTDNEIQEMHEKVVEIRRVIRKLIDTTLRPLARP